MKTFTGFLKESEILKEAAPSGAEYESIITVGYNQGNPPYNLGKAKDKAAFSGVSKFFPEYNKEAQALGKTFRGVTKGTMKQHGASKDTTSALWKKYSGKGKDTPKTDMFTSRHNISLKKKGGSQLMSAAAGEAIATVMGALEMTGKNTKAVKAIADDIENRFTKLMVDGSIEALMDPEKDRKGSFKDMSKTERQKKIKEKIKIDEMHKDLGDSINTILNKHNNVKENIVYIATTGYSKFPEGSRGIANKLIEFDPKSGKLTHDIDTGGPDDMSASIKNMAKATSFYCAFKTSKKNPYSTLRTKTGKFEYYQPLPDRTLNELMIDTLLTDLDLYGLDESYKHMTEDMVIENLFKKAIDKVKAIGGSLKDYLSSFFNKIKEGFKRALNGIIKLGKKAFEALLSFLGLEITSAKVRITGVGGIFAS
jgi:hypothetical protein